MVDYTDELRILREMRDNFLLRYGTSETKNPSDREIRDAKELQRRVEKTWTLAIQTSCDESENELVDLDTLLQKLSRRRNYNL